MLFALTFGFEKLPAGLAGGFGAEAFPRLVLGTIMALSLLLALVPQSDEPQPPIPRMVYFRARRFSLHGARTLVGMLAAMFLFLVGMDACGASAACGCCWPVQFPHRRYLGGVRKGFGIPLPQGLFS